jgi:SAM-dependent methyltransferase
MTAPEIFDRRAVRAHRARAARLDASFLASAVRERLVDRLLDMRGGFSRILEIGGFGGLLAESLAAIGREGEIVSLDSCPALLRGRPHSVVADEEFLPFGAGVFDLVIAPLTLHWVNDLPGTLIQIRRILRPDGLFLAAIFGTATLEDLRACLIDAELEIAGGAGPRVSPFVDVRDAGMLLQRAGFGLPVVDSEILTVTYPDALALMRDLRAMGEANAVTGRRRAFTARAVMLRAAALYEARHAEADGRVRAAFEIVSLTAWAPAETQQKPARRGSGQVSLAAIFDGEG